MCCNKVQPQQAIDCLVDSFALSSLSDVNAPWWNTMMMELSPWSVMIEQEYPEVYTVTKPSPSQVGSCIGTLSLLPRAMLMLRNKMQWWWQCNWHTITSVEDWLAHTPTCCHKVQPQQAVDCLADPFASSSSSNIDDQRRYTAKRKYRLSVLLCLLFVQMQ